MTNHNELKAIITELKKLKPKDVLFIDCDSYGNEHIYLKLDGFSYQLYV